MRRRSQYARRTRDREYLVWIKSLPCVCCKTQYMIEAAHVGNRAFGHKCPDLETLPICRWDHRLGPHSQHRLGKRFCEFWKLDRDALVQKFNQEFEGVRAFL